MIMLSGDLGHGDFCRSFTRDDVIALGFGVGNSVLSLGFATPRGWRSSEGHLGSW